MILNIVPSVTCQTTEKEASPQTNIYIYIHISLVISYNLRYGIIIKSIQRYELVGKGEIRHYSDVLSGKKYHEYKRCWLNFITISLRPHLESWLIREIIPKWP